MWHLQFVQPPDPAGERLRSHSVSFSQWEETLCCDLQWLSEPSFNERLFVWRRYSDGSNRMHRHTRTHTLFSICNLVVLVEQYELAALCSLYKKIFINIPLSLQTHNLFIKSHHIFFTYVMFSFLLFLIFFFFFCIKSAHKQLGLLYFLCHFLHWTNSPFYLDVFPRTLI